MKAAQRLFLRSRVILNGIRISKSPEKTEYVFDIADDLFVLGAFNEALARIAKDAGGTKVVRERKLLDLSNIDALLSLPEGSLGRTYAEHMRAHGLDPNFFRTKQILDDQSFVSMRLRQTHDLWHIVTGFQTDVRGEIALQSFVMSYLALPLSLILVGGALIRVALTEPSQIGGLVDAVSSGMALGRQARGVFGYDWEANWATPLADVRRDLGVSVGVVPVDFPPLAASFVTR